MTLADRIEQAEGPSRELDAEIALATRIVRNFSDLALEHSYYDLEVGAPELPHYTGSVDAALTLVPEGEGRWPQLYYIGPNPNNHRKGHRWVIWTRSAAKPFRGESAHSSALAICAAAIRTGENNGR